MKKDPKIFVAHILESIEEIEQKGLAKAEAADRRVNESVELMGGLSKKTPMARPVGWRKGKAKRGMDSGEGSDGRRRTECLYEPKSTIPSPA